MSFFRICFAASLKQSNLKAAQVFNPRPGMGFRITRLGRGWGQNLPPPANSAPMKARITKFLW